MTLTFGALKGDLRQRVDGEVRFDAGSRGAYSTDASTPPRPSPRTSPSSSRASTSG